MLRLPLLRHTTLYDRGMDAWTFTNWVVVACWLLWAAYWLLASQTAKVAQEKQSGRSRAVYLGMLAAGFALIANRRSPYPLNVALFPHSLALRIFGDLICVAGTGFAVWSRHALAGNWSAYVALKKDHQLIEHGPYALVRHPIYSGMLLMLAGSAILSGTLGAVAGLVLCIASFWIKLRQEEELMLRHFPQSYPDYRRRVKRLIPFVY